jgi:hypothetical protein
MSLIHFCCPHCNSALEIDDQYQGQEVACGICGLGTTCPKANPATLQPSESTGPPKNPFDFGDLVYQEPVGAPVRPPLPHIEDPTSSMGISSLVLGGLNIALVIVIPILVLPLSFLGVVLGSEFPTIRARDLVWPGCLRIC